MDDTPEDRKASSILPVIEAPSSAGGISSTIGPTSFVLKFGNT